MKHFGSFIDSLIFYNEWPFHFITLTVEHTSDYDDDWISFLCEDWISRYLSKRVNRQYRHSNNNSYIRYVPIEANKIKE